MTGHPASALPFCTELAQSPVIASDVIVVLCGEDGEARADAVPELLQRGAARHVLLTGAPDDPPRWHGPERLYRRLIGDGVHPGAMSMDTASTNTHEQAINTVRRARELSWRRLLLVASAYHAPRAYLTFLKAVQDAEATETIHLINVPAVAMAWFQPPPGMQATRHELFASEVAKIADYQARGHVASYDEGVAYLRSWAGRA